MRTSPFLFLILPLAALIAPNPADCADWPMFRGDAQRTGYSTETVGYPQKEPFWKINIQHCEFVSSPSIANGVLYIGGHDSCIYALNAQNGEIIWVKKTGAWVESSPLITDGKVVVGGFDNAIHILDLKKGDETTRIVTNGIQISSPGILPNGSLVSGWGYPNQGMLAVVNGTRLAKRSSNTLSWTVPFLQTSYSSPAILGQLAVIGANDGIFYGVDAKEGKTIWTVKTNGGVFLSTPAIQGRAAYFAPGETDPGVYAVNLTDGNILWNSAKVNTQGEDLSDSGLQKAQSLRKQLQRGPRHSGEGLIVPPLQGLGKTVRSQAGDLVAWQWLGGMHTSSVALDERSVFVVRKLFGVQSGASGGSSDIAYIPQMQCIALDKTTGRQRWNFSELRQGANLGFCSSPVITGHMVYFGWGGGKAYGLDKTSGLVKWQATLDGDIIASPAISNRQLYFATMAGSIYSFKLSETDAGIDFNTSTFCYPNPARGKSLTIQFYVNEEAALSMTIFSMAEKPVLHYAQDLPAGEKVPFNWNIGAVANGVYFAKVTALYRDGRKDSKMIKIAVLR
ncbi:MAG: PQQ-binding-like beta-propeller repeat protein [Chitinivibrionales bacterium]|nr:PQQ-binding-like beta-propeller repeat protein [Chitinivibrionales bacterium]